jgi:hypothetical protein
MLLYFALKLCVLKILATDFDETAMAEGFAG